MLERKQAVANFVVYVCLVAFHDLFSLLCITVIQTSVTASCCELLYCFVNVVTVAT